jgi:cytochrome b
MWADWVRRLRFRPVSEIRDTSLHLSQAEKKHRIRVWDLPIRLCHWLLMALVLAAIVTGQLGGVLTQWHGRLGLTLLGLLSFRLTWGFCESTHARFRDFIPGPGRLSAYLCGQWHGVATIPWALSPFSPCWAS